MGILDMIQGDELSGPTQTGEALRTADGSATGVGGMLGSGGFFDRNADTFSSAGAGFQLGTGLGKLGASFSEANNEEMLQRNEHEAQIRNIQDMGMLSRIASGATARDRLNKKRGGVKSHMGALASMLESARTQSK